MQGEPTPLPWRQLAVLALIALIEQTAFNSIGPYLPEMTQTFPEVKDGQVGLYVGMIASAFALAQFTTNYFWGWLSDHIGRKPVILFGTVMSAAAFLLFGFSTRFWHAMLAQVMLGIFNGNQVLIATVMGEITDKSNQSRAFTYLPVLFAVGGITGPALGGLLVQRNNPLNKAEPNPYPFLLPNIVCAVLLAIQAATIMIFLTESLDDAEDLPPLGRRVSEFISWMWGATSSHLPIFFRQFAKRSESTASGQAAPSLLPTVGNDRTELNIFTVDTVLLLATYFIFQLSNVAYNVLYPIFGEGKPPTGRNLSSEEIGVSLACAGLFTIVFQIFIYGRLRAKMGNRVSYRLSHLLYAIAFLIMPFVGYIDGKGIGQGPRWVWAQIGASLVLKTVSAVGGLTCAMMMVCISLFSDDNG
jgi:MFS family permease